MTEAAAAAPRPRHWGVEEKTDCMYIRASGHALTFPGGDSVWFLVGQPPVYKSVRCFTEEEVKPSHAEQSRFFSETWRKVSHLIRQTSPAFLTRGRQIWRKSADGRTGGQAGERTHNHHTNTAATGRH